MQKAKLSDEKTMEVALLAIQNLGLKITHKDESKISFLYNDCDIEYWPLTGWHSGKGIKAGTGLSHLLNQLK